MWKFMMAAAAAVCLSGCGTTVENADVATGFSVMGQQSVTAVGGVAITNSGPAVEQGGRRVYGTSCKNKLWDPSPSRDNAVELMKRQARSLGLNAIHSIEVKDDPSAIAKNCWSAIVASGIAYSAK